MKIFYFLLFFILSLVSFSQEICDNALDDDGDGLVDIADQDCQCLNELIPDPSVNEFSNCPGATGPLDYTTHWFSGYNNDTQYGTADFWHSCGSSHLNDVVFPPSSSNTGYLGFWNTNGNHREFVSTCLASQINSNTNHTLSLDIYTATTMQVEYDINTLLPDTTVFPAQGINLTIYGQPNCIFDILECPSGSWIELGSYQVNPLDEWQSISITISSALNTIGAIAIGSDCSAPTSNGPVGDYFYLDNISLQELSTNSYGFSIIESGDNCSGKVTLDLALDPSISNPTIQWYRNDSALTGQNSSTLIINTHFSSTYSVKVESGAFCEIKPHSIAVQNCDPTLDCSTLTLNTSIDQNEITFIASGGSGNFTYYLDDVSYGSDFQINATEADYWAIVEDDQGCRDSVQISILPAANPCLNSTLNLDTAVNLLDSIVSLSSSGGMGTSTYYLNDTLSNPIGALFDIPSEGSYTFIVKDEELCLDTIEVDIVFLGSSPPTPSTSENCTNGIDDNGDGLIDLNDPECDCELQTTLNYILNPSFEDYISCPTGPGNWGYTTSVEDFDTHLSRGTFDYYNTCGLTNYGADPPNLNSSHQSGYVGLFNIPGHQYALTGNDYKEYIGNCLQNPFLAGNTYTIEFEVISSFDDDTQTLSPLSEFGFFGTPNCNDIPFSGHGCPLNSQAGGVVNNFLGIYASGPQNWLELGIVSMTTQNGWETLSLTFTPSTDINAFALGPSCSTPLTRGYYYLDNIRVNQITSTTLISTGNFCNQNILLSAQQNFTNPSYQWFKEGIAIIGETTDQYNIPPNQSGLFTVQIMGDEGCVALDTTILSENCSDPCQNSNLEIDTNVNLSDSTITLSSSGGIGAGEFYLSDTSTNAIGSVFDIPSDGSYTFIVKDEALCLDTIEVSIVFPVINPPANNDPCLNSNLSLDTIVNLLDSTVSLSSFGGIGTSTYYLNDTNSASIGSLFDIPSDGSYTFIVKDEALCLDTIEVSIVFPVINPPANNDPCLNSNLSLDTIVNLLDSTVSLSSFGGIGTSTYYLNDTNSASIGNVFDIPSDGSYTFIVKDDQLCLDTIEV